MHPGEEKKLRERYILNMRAYIDNVMGDKRDILGIRKGNIEWTKLQEGKDAELMTTKVHKETTKFNKWFIRQMLRAVETICALTESASQDPDALQGTVLRNQIMMGDHEEEILRHLKTVCTTWQSTSSTTSRTSPTRCMCRTCLRMWSSR